MEKRKKAMEKAKKGVDVTEHAKKAIAGIPDFLKRKKR